MLLFSSLIPIVKREVKTLRQQELLIFTFLYAKEIKYRPSLVLFNIYRRGSYTGQPSKCENCASENSRHSKKIRECFVTPNKLAYSCKAQRSIFSFTFTLLAKTSKTIHSGMMLRLKQACLLISL